MLYLLLSDKNCCDNDSTDSCLALKPPKYLSLLSSRSNTFSSDINNTPENIINSKEYDINQLRALKEFTDKSFLLLFNLNTCPLPKNIDDLENSVQSTKTDFESRLIKDKLPPNDVGLTNYSQEFFLTEASAGGTLIYIRNHLAHKIGMT